MGRLGLETRPQELAHLQAVAAIGQSCLVEAYERSLRSRRRHAAQVLLVADDLKQRPRYLNIRNTLRALVDYGAVPHAPPMDLYTCPQQHQQSQHDSHQAW